MWNQRASLPTTIKRTKAQNLMPCTRMGIGDAGSEDGEDGWVPMLDTQLKVEHRDMSETVRFNFYEKPCTSNRVPIQ